MPTPAKNIGNKRPVATSLSSALLSLLDREAKERALFSARTAEQRYVAAMQEVIEDFTSGEISLAEARKRLHTFLDDFGYTPEHGFPGATEKFPAKPGTIEDLSSYGRVNLIVETNTSMASSVSRLAEETMETLNEFPAWRLTRFMQPNGKPRDWRLRWELAGRSVRWAGALRDDFVARKDSPVWQALGDGAGGFSDTLGNPYPPFAFNSGMGWEDVEREEAESLGLDLRRSISLSRPSLAVTGEERELAEKRYGRDFAAMFA